jgi:hypothetical protein
MSSRLEQNGTRDAELEWTQTQMQALRESQNRRSSASGSQQPMMAGSPGYNPISNPLGVAGMAMNGSAVANSPLDATMGAGSSPALVTEGNGEKGGHDQQVQPQAGQGTNGAENGGNGAEAKVDAQQGVPGELRLRLVRSRCLCSTRRRTVIRKRIGNTFFSDQRDGLTTTAAAAATTATTATSHEPKPGRVCRPFPPYPSAICNGKEYPYSAEPVCERAGGLGGAWIHAHACRGDRRFREEGRHLQAIFHCRADGRMC